MTFVYLNNQIWLKTINSCLQWKNLSTTTILELRIILNKLIVDKKWISIYCKTTKTTSIQVSIFCMSKFQLNTFYKILLLRSTINSQKRKQNVSKTRKIDRVSIYYRELISMFYRMHHEIRLSLFFLRETLNAFQKRLLC